MRVEVLDYCVLLIVLVFWNRYFTTYVVYSNGSYSAESARRYIFTALHTGAHDKIRP